MLTQEYLKECLYYNTESGIFTWKERKDMPNNWNARRSNTIAGAFGADGYSRIQINKTLYLAHRLAWFYIYGVWPKMFLDHINHVVSDNRIANLREVNNSQNNQNQIKPRSNNKSGHLGVSYNKNVKKYCAQININGKQTYLGLFLTPELAYEAYLQAKRKHHPFCTI